MFIAVCLTGASVDVDEVDAEELASDNNFLAGFPAGSLVPLLLDFFARSGLRTGPTSLICATVPVVLLSVVRHINF